MKTRSRASSAFTLIEVVISSALVSIILVSAYLCLSAAMSSRRMVEPRVEVLQNARVAMALMSADLRNACVLSKDVEFLGMHRTLDGTPADNLDFGTHNYTPRRAREGDFCQVSYFLDKDPESGQLILWRRRNPRIAPDPLSGGTREELGRGLAGMRLEYFDGFDWFDTWGDVEGNGKRQTSNRVQSNLSGLPDAVRITLMFESNPRAKKAVPSDGLATNEPPMVFQTVARLALAPSLRSGGSSSAPASDSTPDSNPGTPVEGATQ
jgi:prepilin-type N-terminal cleavage/methylation domain-containing protein